MFRLFAVPKEISKHGAKVGLSLLLMAIQERNPADIDIGKGSKMVLSLDNLKAANYSISS